MSEMALEKDTDYGFCGEGAEAALDNTWLSLAEKVRRNETLVGRGHSISNLSIVLDADGGCVNRMVHK